MHPRIDVPRHAADRGVRPSPNRALVVVKGEAGWCRGALDGRREMVERASQPRSGVLATAVGLAMSALGASGVFGQLQQALNDIWDVKT